MAKLLTGSTVGGKMIATTEDVDAVAVSLATHKSDYVAHPGVGTTTNTSNAYAVTLNPAPTSYVDKMGLVLSVNADSTGATTINVNGLGAKAIKKANGSNVTNLKANGVYTLRYNVTTGNFILQGEGGSGNATASDLLSGKTASTDAGDIVGTMPNRGTFNLGLGVSVPSGYYSGGTTATGKRSVSGTATSNEYASIIYTDVGTFSMFQLVVSGLALPFTPSLIKITKVDKTDYPTFYSSSTMFTRNGISYKLEYAGRFVEDNSFIVNSNGFTIPVNIKNETYEYTIYE